MRFVKATGLCCCRRGGQALPAVTSPIPKGEDESVSAERERECGKKQVQRQTVWEKGREWGGIEGMRKRIGIMCQSLQNSGREGIDLFHLGLCTIPYLLSPTLRQEVPCGQETAWRYHSNQCVGSRIKVHRAEKKYSMIMQDHIHEWLIKPAKIRQFWIILHVAIPIAIIM